MGIKQQGGVFGRNPTFNNVTVDGTLTIDQIVEKTGATGITLDGVTLKDGNVVLANGNGIDFSATSGSGSSELFDDYEEGTFTATLNGSTSQPGTLLTTTASYTKMGNVVHFEIDLAGDTTGYAGNISISGLPFTSLTETTQVAAIYNAATWTGSPAARIANNKTNMFILDVVSGSPWTFLQHDPGSGRVILITGSYITS